LIAAIALFAANAAFGRETLHRHVSRDSFLHEQFTTKAEFIEALREHPRVLRKMAQCVQTSPGDLLNFIEEDVHLGRLQKTRRYLVWGLTSRGRRYKSWHRFKAGMPVWVEDDGTPIFRWLCGNPMVTSIPSMTQPSPPPPPPSQTPAPAPETPTPPAPPVEATPPPPPPLAPEPAPAPAPPPAEAPAPPPPPPPPSLAVSEPCGCQGPRPTRIEVGDLQWTGHRDRDEGIVTAGVSEDLVKTKWGGHLGLYGEQAGIFQHSAPYRYFGGGVEYRQNLGRGHDVRPYAGVGVGGYHVVVHDWSNHSYDRWGEKAFIGVDTKSGVFLELSAGTFGKTRQRQLTTYGVSIGLRF